MPSVHTVLASLFGGQVCPRERRMPWPKQEKLRPELLSHYHKIGSTWNQIEESLCRIYGRPMYRYQAGELVRSPSAKESVFWGTLVPPLMDTTATRNRKKKANEARVLAEVAKAAR